MKPSHIIAIILSAALLIWACVPKPDVVPGMPGEQNADELFSSAEKQFEVQSYDQALVLYTEYFRRFADKPMAAAVLMKIGIIHALAGEYEKARSAFQKILSEYPDSSVVPDALVEELFTYYQQGRYQEVIDLAPEILGQIDSRAHISKTYMLMGDTFMAAGSPIDAVDYYARSQRFATELEQQTITEKLKEAIAHLESADIAVLLKHADESLPMDFLLFQLGLNYSMEERYDDALAKLTEFVIKYPEHDNRMLAVSLIDEIKKNAVFNRFTVGCLLPLSGAYQSFGQRALKGIELALAQFSSQNENPPINIIIRDTGADPNKTVAALNELYHQQVAAILGPIVTSEIAAREAQLMGVPIITLTQKDNIPEIGDNVFRNFITPKMQVQALASFTVESLGLNRFAILYPDETYGLTFMNLFWDELIELGGMVVGVEAYNPKQTDYTDPIKKLVGLYYEVPEDLKPIDDLAPEPANEEELKQAEAKDEEIGDEEAQAEEEPESIVDFDAIFIPDSPGKAGQIVPQLAYFDIKDVYMLGTNLWHSDSLIKIAHQYVQGAVFPDGFFAGSASPRVQKFVKSFEETYEETPGYIEAVVYDSAMILFHVVSRPHIRFRSEIRDELLNLDNFQGVTGLTRFDEYGDVQKKLHLLRIKGKRFVELE
ncbi:MAG: ABC transporter substrate-binding protein [Desulfobacterales bacterium]|nr:ABC transporter substrate-binding protein [Desulfobacterales bacterium]